MAEIIRQKHVTGVNDNSIKLVNYEQFCRDWVGHFVSRYPQLESARRKLIDAVRAKSVSAERLIVWFEELQRVIKTDNIVPKNLYNMYESGFAMGDVEASHRIIATI